MRNLIEFPTINQKATGERILQLRLERHLSIRELQVYFGFEEPAAIYRWQRGDNLPSLDNMLALSKLFGVPIEDILVLNPIKDTGERRSNPDKSNAVKLRNLALFLIAA